MTNTTSFNKTKIIKKVTLLFHSKGYSATSMQDIVDITGLNRSSVYNTFGSKLKLYLTCFSNCEIKYRRDIQQVILSSTNTLKSLREILEISINIEYNGYLIPNYVSETKNKESLIQELIKNQQEYILVLFEDIIKQGQNLGTINNSKSQKQYAYFLANSYFGLQTMKNFEGNKNQLQNVIYDVISILE